MAKKERKPVVPVQSNPANLFKSKEQFIKDRQREKQISLLTAEAKKKIEEEFEKKEKDVVESIEKSVDAPKVGRPKKEKQEAA